jgi:hypothetical protein
LGWAVAIEKAAGSEKVGATMPELDAWMSELDASMKELSM